MSILKLGVIHVYELLIYEAKTKVTEEEILDFLFKKISVYKIPKITLSCKQLGLTEIPKASNGKILRKKIIVYANEYFKKKKN